MSIATRKRVQEVIDRYGYQPDPLARGLRLKRSTHVMILRVMGGSFSRYANCGSEFEVVENLIDAVSKRGSLAVFRRVYSLDREQLRGLAEECGARSVVLVGMTLPSGWREALAGAVPQLEIVEVDDDCVGVHDVPMNERRGASMVVRHLIDSGCSNVAYLGDDRYPLGSARYQGFRDGCGRRETSASHILQFDSGCGMSFAESLESLLAGWQRPDGLFAATDALGIRVIEALHELGSQVPRDLKVAAMGGTLGAARCDPPMTTFAPSTADAIDALAHRLCGPSVDMQSPTELPNGSLIIRASSVRET